MKKNTFYKYPTYYDSCKGSSVAGVSRSLEGIFKQTMSFFTAVSFLARDKITLANYLCKCLHPLLMTSIAK